MTVSTHVASRLCVLYIMGFNSYRWSLVVYYAASIIKLLACTRATPSPDRSSWRSRPRGSSPTTARPLSTSRSSCRPTSAGAAGRRCRSHPVTRTSDASCFAPLPRGRAKDSLSRGSRPTTSQRHRCSLGCPWVLSGSGLRRSTRYPCMHQGLSWRAATAVPDPDLDPNLDPIDVATPRATALRGSGGRAGAAHDAADAARRDRAGRPLS